MQKAAVWFWLRSSLFVCGIDKATKIPYNKDEQKESFHRRYRDVKPVSRGRDGDLKPISRVEQTTKNEQRSNVCALLLFALMRDVTYGIEKII